MTKIRLLVGMVALFVIGVALGSLGWTQRAKLKNAKDISETRKLEEGKWIKGTTDESVGCYCYETEEKDGKKTEKFRWYLVWFTSLDKPDGGYIGVKVPAKEFSKYEQLVDSDLEYELTYQGELKKCTGEVLQYKKEFQKKWQEEIEKEAKKAGYPAASYKIADYCPDYYVELKTTKDGMIMMGIGIALFVFGIICGIAFIHAVRSDGKEARQYAEAMSRMQQSTEPVQPYTPFAPYTPGGSGAAGSKPEPENVGAASGFNLYSEQDELSKMLAEEDQKISQYNFESNLTGSNRVEDDK